MEDDRIPRKQTSRIANPIHEPYDTNWEQKGMLDTSNIPAKEGMVQRWVRTIGEGGRPDLNNVYNKKNQGWNVRPCSDVEKGKMIPHVDFQGQDVIGIHGQILMERPIGQHKSQRDYLRKQTDLQIQGVKQSLYREQGRGDENPRFNGSSAVSRGRVAQADED